MVFSNTAHLRAARTRSVFSRIATFAAIALCGACITLATGCGASVEQQQQPISDSSTVGSEEWVAEQFN